MNEMVDLTPETVLHILKHSGGLSCTWPPDRDATKRQRIVHHVKWYFVMVNVIALLIPLICAVYYNRHAVAVMMKTLSELTALGDVFFNLLITKFQQKRLQALLAEVNDYTGAVKGAEKKILHRHMNRYVPFCMFVGLSYLQTAIAFSCGPLVLSTILPADAWYPFPIELFSTSYFLVYFQQVLTILQTGMCITVDFMVALLLSYLSTRLEILNHKFQSVNSQKHLDACIDEHQSYIRFSDDLTKAVRLIILKSNVTMAMAAIFGAFPIIFHQPLPVISQFILMVIAGCLRLYVSAWPADDVREISEEIGWSLYMSPWIGTSRKMQKTVRIVIRRAQKPLVISVHGILPALTLRFYASFLSSTLSYFMTLRAILHN